MSNLYSSFAEVVITGIWFVHVYMRLWIDSLVLWHRCKVDVNHHEGMVIMILSMHLV